MYTLTGSTFAVGAIALVELIPLLTLTFIGGAAADAVDRRRLLIWTELGTAASVAGLVVNAALPDPKVGALLRARVLRGGVLRVRRRRVAFDDPAARRRGALHRRARAQLALQQSRCRRRPGARRRPDRDDRHHRRVRRRSRRLHLLAACLLAAPVDHAGRRRRAGRPALGDPGLPLPVRPAGDPRLLPRRHERDDLRHAVRAVRGLCDHHLHAGPALVGYLYTAPAVGALGVSLFSGWIRHVRRQGVAIFIAAILWGVAIIAFGFASACGSALTFLGAAGAADAVSAILRNSVMLRAHAGRDAGTRLRPYLMQVASAPTIGNLEAGALASRRACASPSSRAACSASSAAPARTRDPVAAQVRHEEDASRCSGVASSRAACTRSLRT